LGGAKAKTFQTSCNLYGPFKLERTNENPSSEITEVHWFCKTMIVVLVMPTSAYGSVEKQPCLQSMVLASLLRKISPSEKVTIPLPFFCHGENIKM
jgi:hypothetical protein